jgi:predicted DNA-binding transcriptional regulator AlpA
LSEKSGAESVEHNPVLTVSDLARRWHVSKSWVYHRAQTRQLPVLNIGGLTRFPLADIEAMERGETVPLGVRVVVPR